MKQSRQLGSGTAPRQSSTLKRKIKTTPANNNAIINSLYSDSKKVELASNTDKSGNLATKQKVKAAIQGAVIAQESQQLLDLVEQEQGTVDKRALATMKATWKAAGFNEQDIGQAMTSLSSWQADPNTSSGINDERVLIFPNDFDEQRYHEILSEKEGTLLHILQMLPPGECPDKSELKNADSIIRRYEALLKRPKKISGVDQHGLVACMVKELLPLALTHKNDFIWWYYMFKTGSVFDLRNRLTTTKGDKLWDRNWIFAQFQGGSIASNYLLGYLGCAVFGVGPIGQSLIKGGQHLTYALADVPLLPMIIAYHTALRGDGWANKAYVAKEIEFGINDYQRNTKTQTTAEQDNHLLQLLIEASKALATKSLREENTCQKLSAENASKPQLVVENAIAAIQKATSQKAEAAQKSIKIAERTLSKGAKSAKQTLYQKTNSLWLKIKYGYEWFIENIINRYVPYRRPKNKS
ncbi:MAG: hypothetical protein JW841_17715 [Deltaproteobacteria bacterium]|nr:hypothetical protein [Deltaproteobacteria bacterium]